MITPKPHIDAMQGFALADLTAPDGMQVISLAQNESAYPPSPKALEAMLKALADVALYPDPDWADLRQSIAARHDLDPAKILCSAGSMDLIAALIHAFSGAGDRVLSTAHGYGYFATSAHVAGAAYDAAPETNLTVDVDALLTAMTPQTRLVCIANPGNPTGTRITRTEILRLRNCLPDDVILLLDEAYAEFTDPLGEAMFDLVDRGDTVITRSFSKAHALAGQRIGWGLFPPHIGQHARKLVTAGGVTAVSLAAAAASMRDPYHVAQTVRKTAQVRDRFIAHMNQISITCAPSHTNFALLQFESVAKRERADAALRAKGIIMRPMAGYGLPQCLRATIASAEVMQMTGDVLAQWKQTEP